MSTIANYVASRHDEKRIRQTRPYQTSSVGQVVPPDVAVIRGRVRRLLARLAFEITRRGLIVTCSGVSSLEPAAASIATPLSLVLRRLAFTCASRRLLSRSLFCTCVLAAVLRVQSSSAAGLQGKDSRVILFFFRDTGIHVHAHAQASPWSRSVE